MVAQFEVALGNLLTALAAAGGRPDQLASLTVYLVDLDDYKSARGRSSARCGGGWPAGTTRPWPAVGVARLWDAAALVEVQGMADPLSVLTVSTIVHSCAIP